MMAELVVVSSDVEAGSGPGPSQTGEPGLADIWVGCSAMVDHHLSYLHLEVPLRVGAAFTGVCSLEVFDSLQLRHRVRTKISKQMVEIRGTLRNGYQSFLIMDAIVAYEHERWVMTLGPQSKVFPRQEASTGGFSMVIETCAGLGALGVGLGFAGMRTLVMNDVNSVMCSMAEKHRPQTPVIQGDIGHPATIAALAEISEWPVILAAGVACQPYSQLGDQGGENDSRAQSLPSTLKASHLLGCPVVVLECVEKAHSQPWVQSILSQFCQQTGFQVSQTILHLDHVWISRRTRWWCVLVHPSLGGVDLHPMPQLLNPPVLGDVLPQFLQNFQDYGGLETNVASLNAQGRTCLHSCGSQLSGCPCGCRRNGFTSQRMGEKGLHGILIPVEGCLKHSNGDVYPKLRHVHPWELSIMNGLPPDWNWHQELKKALVGIGQLASPIQSVWIGSQINQMLRRQDLLRTQVPSPCEALGNLLLQLFRSRDKVFQGFDKPARLTEFEFKLFSLLGLVPPGINMGLSPPKGQDQLKPQTAHNQDQVTDLGSSKGSHNYKAHSTQQAQQSKDHDQQTAPEQDEQSHNTSILSPRETQDLHNKGAVPGFDAKIIKPEPQRATDTPGTSCSQESLAPTIPYDGDESHNGPEPIHLEVLVQGIGQMGVAPVKVTQGTTVGMVVQAECQTSKTSGIITPINILGEAWSLGKTIEQHQIILTRNGTQWNPNKCPREGGTPPSIPPQATRLEALLQQEGWVAMDEMQHYIESLAINTDFGKLPPCEFYPDREWSHQMDQWLGNDPFVTRQVSSKGQGIATVALIQDHWVPITITLGDSGLLVHIPPEAPALQEAVQEWAGSTKCNVVHVPLPHKFRADCGWQSLAWLIAIADQIPLEAISIDKACGLREAFMAALIAQGQDGKPAKGLRFGGMISHQELQGKLTVLLQDHGVPPDQRTERANKILQSIGTQPVAKAFQSMRPWQELKQLANQCQPRFQLVLPSELQQQLAARARSQQPVHRGRQRKVEETGEKRPIPNIEAGDIAIPHGVFRQEDGSLLAQITMADVSKTCKGLLVQSQVEGATMLKATRPVTKEGLGLLIVPPPPNADEKLLIKFPAHFRATEEPVILVGEMHQLGEKQVVRNLPEQQLAIEETATEVVRCLVFRDEHSGEWQEFKSQPVKHILERLNLDAKAGQGSGVLDVWDRQWVTHRFERMKPERATLFIVSLRLEASKLQDTLQKSGDDGVYVEPRASHGRGQNPEYAITWLHKSTTLSEAKLARQTSQHPATLARVGTRYGLRSDVYHQQEMHKQHKPESMFLPTGERQMYLIGPLPYGTTHQGLAKILQAWEWEARPLQPRGRTSDGSGAQWVIQATAPPSHWVYTLKHGDVLITTMPAKQPPNVPRVPYVASKKTISAAEDKADPWQIRDPWSKAATLSASSTSSTSTGVTQSQIAAIEEAVQTRVVAAIKAQTDTDVNMEGALDSRVSKLEAQLETLQQSQSNTDGKVTHLQHQIEAQTHAFKQHVSTELASHMAQMESHMSSLLAKARRLE